MPLTQTVEQLIAQHGYAYVMEAIKNASVGCATRLQNQAVADSFADFLRSTANDVQIETRRALAAR